MARFLPSDHCFSLDFTLQKPTFLHWLFQNLFLCNFFETTKNSLILSSFCISLGSSCNIRLWSASLMGSLPLCLETVSSLWTFYVLILWDFPSGKLRVCRLYSDWCSSNSFGYNNFWPIRCFPMILLTPNVVFCNVATWCGSLSPSLLCFSRLQLLYTLVCRIRH